MEASLIVEKVDETARLSQDLESKYALDPSKRITIGRFPENSIYFHSTSISSRHCQIEIDGEYFVVTDLNSTNGTYVNGSKIRKRKLYNEDLIQIGNIELRFKWQEDEDSDDNITEAEVELPWQVTEELQKDCIDHYRVLEKVGRGGIGEVYRVEDLSQPNRFIAIKILHPKGNHHETIAERFIREGKALMAMDHPRIIKVFELGTYKNRPYFTMEYVKGKTVTRFISQNGPLGYRTACKISGHIAHALAYTHEQNIIHRDLKPSNIILADDTYDVKMIDLGLAKMHEEVDITVNRQVIGTPRYMAPEQMRNARDVDPRADVYSLGATLYFMLTGVSPFAELNSKNRTEMLKYIYNRPPIPIKEFAEIPPEVNHIVEKAMSKDKDKRYATANDMYKAIYRTVYKLKG